MQSPLTLLELTQSIKNQLDQRFHGQIFQITAEVTNLKFYPAKNYFFLELIQKEENGSALVAKMGASIFSTGTTRIRQFEQITGRKFENNLCVLASVEVDYHVQYGLKLIIRDIDSNYTLGELEKQRQETLRRLVAHHPEWVSFRDGVYHSYNQRLQLPHVIQRIAVITSQASDGYRDFYDELIHNRYGYHFEITPFFTAVQGVGAGKSIADLLEKINVSKQVWDAVVIVRGGGSQVDFMAFDDYDAARAVAGLHLPVFSGIGHLKNESIVDLMAFRALKTPTKAAEEIINHNQKFEAAVLVFQRDIQQHTRWQLSAAREKLTRFRSGLYQLSRRLIDHEQQKQESVIAALKKNLHVHLTGKKKVLDILSGKIFHKTEQSFGNERMKLKWMIVQILSYSKIVLRNKKNQLTHHQSLIRMSNPAHILKRGFALVYLNDKIVTRPDQIEKDTTIEIYLGDENIAARVLQKNKDHERRFDV